MKVYVGKHDGRGVYTGIIKFTGTQFIDIHADSREEAEKVMKEIEGRGISSLLDIKVADEESRIMMYEEE